MNRLRVFLTLMALGIPLGTRAAESSFFGPIVPAACNCPDAAPEWGCVLEVIRNLMNFGISFGVIIIVLMLAYAGFMFIMSAANAEMRSKGKQAVTNAVIGLLIMLSAWLIVDFVMKQFYNPSSEFGPWNSILSGGEQCIQATTPTKIAGLPDIVSQVVNGVIVGSGYTGTGGGGGGACTVPENANHPCSVQSLAGTCFAASGEHASMVCNKESGGRSVPSGSDKLNGGSGPSYSWGLWQINLTTTDTLKAGWGMDCRKAFSGPCQGSALLGGGKCSQTVKDQRLYTECTQKASDPRLNTVAACNLYTPNMSAWACSAQRCGVPGARTVNDPVCRAGS